MDSTRDGVSSAAFVQHRPPFRTPVNVYCRPIPSPSSQQQQQQQQQQPSTSPPSISSASSSGYSSIGVPESPRRGSLFSSFKLKHKKDSSPRGSPTGPSILVEGVISPNEQTAVSPRRLSFFDQFPFRQRSKSDCRPRKQPSRGVASSTAKPYDDPNRPPMMTIPSIDEDKINLSPPRVKTPERLIVKPLFIDTKLANHRSGNQQQSSLSARSPVTQMVDYVRQRQRTLSGSNSAYVVDETKHKRTSSSSSTTPNDYVENNYASLHNSQGKKYIHLPLLMGQKSLDSSLDYDRQSPSPAIIIRDPVAFLSGGADAMQSFSLENEDLVYSQFMKAHKAYDLIPTSSKLVVFDTQLPVKKAFFALVYNGVRAAPLFDGVSQQFIGMLTITDFIDILQRYYKTGVSHIKELEEHKIATWREVQHKKVKPFVSIDPNESLFKAVQLLLDHKVHRLPVTDRSTGNILYILTHKRMLRFLYLYIYDLPRPSFLAKTPFELGIGTHGTILTVHQDTPLVEAFSKFLEYRVSALPVVDELDRIVDIYAKFDVINLAADKTYNNLDITIQEALKHRSDWFEGVVTVKRTDSLSVVIETLVKAEVHRLIITDDEKRVCGVVSLSDIFKFLVLRPTISSSEPLTA